MLVDHRKIVIQQNKLTDLIVLGSVSVFKVREPAAEAEAARREKTPMNFMVMMYGRCVGSERRLVDVVAVVAVVDECPTRGIMIRGEWNKEQDHVVVCFA